MKTGVEFNLLPQSRSAVMAAQARRDYLMSKALKASFACFCLFLLLFIYANIVQPSQISSSKKSIAASSAKLQQVPNISTILTVQNQLKTAAALNQSKHINSRIFSYLAALTPTNAGVGDLVMDLGANTIRIDGTADTANTVNALIDALKSSQYSLSGVKAPAFSGVVENGFVITDKGVTYSVNANFDPALFANSQPDASGKPTAPKLTVPSSVTSRGSTDPASVFGQGSQK